MAQYISKSALVAEINRQQRKLYLLGQSNEVELRKSAAIQNGVYYSLLSFIDSLQEEPVKRTPADIEAAMQEVEEKSRVFTEAHKGEDTDTIFAQMRGEEPVSEELEEASKNYALNNTPWDDCKDEIQESFNAGAKWQKAKGESTTEDLGDYINKLSKQFPEVSFAKLSRIAVRVAKWQKEQMMAKAVNVEVKVDAGGYPYIPQMELYDYDKDVPFAKKGDRYKVILIKEG